MKAGIAHRLDFYCRVGNANAHHGKKCLYDAPTKGQDATYHNMMKRMTTSTASCREVSRNKDKGLECKELYA